MVEVEFLGPIGLDNLQLDIKNLHELKEELQKIPNLKQWLSVSAISVNDEIISSLDTPLKDGDKISLLPPVCGG